MKIADCRLEIHGLSILDCRFTDCRFSIVTVDCGFSILDSRFSILDSRFSNRQLAEPSILSPSRADPSGADPSIGCSNHQSSTDNP